MKILLSQSVAMEVAYIFGMGYLFPVARSIIVKELRAKTAMAELEASRKWASSMVSLKGIEWRVVWVTMSKMMIGLIWSVYTIASWLSLLKDIVLVSEVKVGVGGTKVAIAPKFTEKLKKTNWVASFQITQILCCGVMWILLKEVGMVKNEEVTETVSIYLICLDGRGETSAVKV